MKYIKFNKTLCGVDFLLNVLKFKINNDHLLLEELQAANFFQIIFIKKGKGHLYLNAQKIELKDNMVLFISQNQQHKWAMNQENFEATFLVFQEDFLNEFFSDTHFIYKLLYFYQINFPLYLQVEKNLLDELITKLYEIKVDLKQPKNDSVHLIRSILYYILIKLNRIYANQHQITSPELNKDLAFQFRKSVEKHIYTKQRVDDYVEILGVSRISLNKMVKKQFNTTLSDFIKSRLLFEIKMKLAYTQKTIEELAYTFNFSEPNHFTRFFKTRVGQTPVEYRLAYQNGSSS